MESIAIESDQASAVSPEGVRKTICVRDLLHKAVARPIDTGDFVLSDGIKSIKSCGNVLILIHETPTQVFSLRWISSDSPVRFGHGCQYRTVRIALPYLITLAVFQTVRRRLTLSKVNECFFSNRPLTSLDDQRTRTARRPVQRRTSSAASDSCLRC